MALVLLGRIASAVFPNQPVGGVLRVGFAAQLAVLVSVILLLPLDLALWARRLSQRLRRADASSLSRAPLISEPAPAQASAPEPEVASRREFLAQATVGSAFLIGSSSSLYGSLAGRHDYQLEDVPVRLPGLSRALDGFIVQLSDIHVGQVVGDVELAAAESLVRRARLKNGWVAGLYRERGSQLYVNRGFGTAGPPARIGAPPEVTRVVLTT